MASIVYITDRDMFEFHRLNGDKTMNFWRPGSLRKMSDFKPGDLLFFLVKGTERGINREKGVMGYGRYVEGNTMSIGKMWKTYGFENGYINEDRFREAVLKVSKSKETVKNVSSLYLTNCVYFGAPIYLSEIGVGVSNMMESYCYLDKDDPFATTKILEKAKEIGLDSWMAMVSDYNEEESPLELDAARHVVAEVMKSLCPFYDEVDAKKAVKMCSAMKKSMADDQTMVEMIKGVKEALMSITENRIEIFVPLVSTNKEIYRKIQQVVGHATVIKGLLKQKHLNYNIEVTVIVDTILSIEQQQMLHAGNISYLYLEK